MQNKLKNTIASNKIFSLAVILSIFFSLLSFPPIQTFCIFLLNRIFNKSIELDSIWQNRFIEHSLKCIAIFLGSGAVIQYFNNTRLEVKIFQYNSVLQSKITRLDLIIFFVYFAICALFMLSICSTCSFLYPFHTWDDSNCFFTVGKSVWFGKVMYRDLFEQKGPLLYFIHSFAYLISHRSFIGIFIFEVIAATFFMFFCWKTLALFSSKFCGIFVPLIAAVAFSSTSFVLGDSAEEFCLPIFMCSFYTSVKHLKENSDFKNSEFFITGILSGCVLWIKFNLLGFYIGWCIVPIFMYAKQKKWKEIALAFLLVFAGILVATVPYLIYFGANHAIKDWFKVYFYDNIFLYTVKKQDFILVTLAKALLRFYWRNYFYTLTTVLSLIILIKLCFRENKTIIIHFLIIYVATIFFIYGGGVWNEYYGFHLCLFAIFAIVPIYVIFKVFFENSDKFKIKKIIAGFLCAFFIISFFTAFSITKNKSILSLKKEDLPQFKFDKIISQHENPTLLNYGTLDSGFYTVSGIVPSNRFFISIHVSLKEMDDEQNKIVKEGLVDFVVAKTEISSNKYKLVSTATSNIRKHFYTFYLYENKNLTQK